MPAKRKATGGAPKTESGRKRRVVVVAEEAVDRSPRTDLDEIRVAVTTSGLFDRLPIMDISVIVFQYAFHPTRIFGYDSIAPACIGAVLTPDDESAADIRAQLRTLASVSSLHPIPHRFIRT
jgi:hypothetical protein